MLSSVLDTVLDSVFVRVLGRLLPLILFRKLGTVSGRVLS